MWAQAPQTLDALLGDPLIQAVMRADRVEPGALKVILTSVGERVAADRRALKLDLEGARVRLPGEPLSRREQGRITAPPVWIGAPEACFCR